MAEKEFSVDAALLQELGERLVGRPHIAVAELIKNAYDADASTCEVKIEDNLIIITDDGEGMDLDSFEKGYLRLGAQHKRVAGKSNRLGRPLTGAKGVGRLATQFLGSKLRVETCSERHGQDAVVAEIDWSRIEAGEELQKFKVNVETTGESEIEGFPDESRHGTRITIERMRVNLDQDDIRSLGSEVWSLRSPFSRFGKGRSGKDRNDPEHFEIRFQSGETEFEESFDAILDDLVERVWRACITGRVSEGRSTDAGEIEIEFTEGYPANAPAEIFSDRIGLSGLRPIGAQIAPPAEFGKPLIHEVRFKIYVYKLERKQMARMPLGELRDYLARFGNVSIYDAGFRLPYYGIDADWLQNGADHSRRLSVSSLLPSKWGIDGRYMIDLPEPRRIFGIVEINSGGEARTTTANSPFSGSSTTPGSWLEIQPGRDRLHDNDAYRQLQSFVRYALDLYANRFRARALRAAERTADREPPARKFKRLTQMLEESRNVIPHAVYEEARNEAKSAEAAAKSQESRFIQRISAIAPLAAAGIAALAMTHELNREMRSLEFARGRLRLIAKTHDLPDVARTAEELGLSLERMRSLQGLFAPLLSEDDREHRFRLRVEPVVLQVADGMRPLTPGMAISIDIENELRFPVGTLATWNAILQNVISNAWNACLASGAARIEIEGFENDGDGVLWISDTGVGIDLEDSDRLFDAFEKGLKLSPEHAPLALGGMGMGLPIVRMLAQSHKVDAAFVKPESGYSTTFQMTWRI